MDSIEEAPLMPEREALHFDLSLDDVEPELLPVVDGIKKMHSSMMSITDNVLFRWKSFPIVPPKLISDKRFTGDPENSIFKNLFVAPTFDELEEVALDNATGQAKSLTKPQLDQIRKNGEFNVKSVHFEGEIHTWRLSALLQKGNTRALSSLLDDAALALKLIIIVALDRFTSHFFSLAQAGRALVKSLWQFCDLLIGMPRTSLNESSLMMKLQNEHSKFLVAELCNMETIKWSEFCEFVKLKVEEQKEKHFLAFEADNEKMVGKAPPYLFKTPNGVEIDLRLFNKDLMIRCTSILHTILEHETKGWYIKYKESLIVEYRGKNFTPEQIKEKVNESIQEEYMKRVVKAVHASESLESMQPQIGRLLVQQATCVISMKKSVLDLEKKMLRLQNELEETLKTNYPIRSRIKVWMKRQIRSFQSDFIIQHRIAAHETTIESCKQWQLGQSVYFLNRDMLFIRDREPALRREFERIKEVDKTFHFRIRKWFPSNWVVSRRESRYTASSGKDEVIPTVISNKPAIYTATSPHDNFKTINYTYAVRKYSTYQSTSRYPFWRWMNCIYRGYTWTWSSMYYLMIVIPWNSQISLRALFYGQSFMPKLLINEDNGQLCPDRTVVIHTLSSRLKSLWKHVNKSRNKFEASSNTGFLDKSLTRHLNRFWNYVLKGAFGSFLMVVVMVPSCLFGSVTSILLGVTAPIWMPVSTVLLHIFYVCVYDFDHPSGSNAVLYLLDTLVYRLLVQGLLQPVVSLAVVVLCPFGSLLVLLWGGIRYSNRTMWDAFMFNALIARRGRIPSKDSFVSRRIAGPGLASDYFYQIQPAQALAAIESRMQIDELRFWKRSTLAEIEIPKQIYQKVIRKCFIPFSGVLSEQGTYLTLMKDGQKLIETLNSRVYQREKLLNTGLIDDGEIATRVKVRASELKVILGHAARMLSHFYPDKVLSRTDDQEAFWEKKGLDTNDWKGLANQLLSEIFSPEFLIPLEDTNKSIFHLEVEHLNLSRYIDMLKDSKFRDDLDVVNPVHIATSKIDVNAPFMQISVFNPVQDNLSATGLFTTRPHHSWLKPWKMGKNRRILVTHTVSLTIPLPIAHPATICLIVYDRENELDAFRAEDYARIERVIKSSQALTFDFEPETLKVRSNTPPLTTGVHTGGGGTSTQTVVPLASSDAECYVLNGDDSLGYSDDPMNDSCVMEMAYV